MRINDASIPAEFEYTGIECITKIPKNVAYVRFHPSVVEVGAGVFEFYESLREVVLNEGLKMIGDRAFAHCLSLESLIIPSTVIKIGDGAFMNCIALTSITFPSTTAEINSSAFIKCINLREIRRNEWAPESVERAYRRHRSVKRFKFNDISARLNVIVQTGHYPIESRINEIPTVEWKDGEIFLPAMPRRGENKWGELERVTDFDREKLDKIVKWIRYYEIKEAASLFELALWRAKIDQADDTNTANREACRIEVPGPVKDAILQYL